MDSKAIDRIYWNRGSCPHCFCRPQGNYLVMCCKCDVMVNVLVNSYTTYLPRVRNVCDTCPNNKMVNPLASGVCFCTLGVRPVY